MESPLAEPDDEHEALRRAGRRVALVQAVQEVEEIPPRLAGVLPDARRDLVHRPEVAERDVVSRGDHAPAELLPGVEPRPPIGRHPRLPRRQVCLGHRMEARAERPDPPRLIRAGHGLVARDGRDRDVVIGAVRPLGCEVLRKPVPVGVPCNATSAWNRQFRRSASGPCEATSTMSTRAVSAAAASISGAIGPIASAGSSRRNGPREGRRGLLVAAGRRRADDEILGPGSSRLGRCRRSRVGDEREHCDRQDDASHDGLLVEVMSSSGCRPDASSPAHTESPRSESNRTYVPSGGGARLTVAWQPESVVHGAREHNLKDVTVRLPRNALSASPGSRAPGSPAWPSTRSMRRGSAATSSRSPPTRASSCR